MQPAEKVRLGWIELYERVRDAGMVCRRCGVSRPTLRKWWRRYVAHGTAGLISRSRRPRRFAQRKVFEPEEHLIRALRTQRRLGSKRLRNELLRVHGLRLSAATVHRVLLRLDLHRLPQRRLQRHHRRRYSRPIPGDRVQMDVCKIGPGCYQYTAVDDCSRYIVVGLFTRRTGANTLHFLDKVVEEMPFAIQRMQTDRGREFFDAKVQRRLFDWAIKFRPNQPRSPQLNGKVERAQRTALEEFWSWVEPKADDLEQQLQERQHHYNWERPHTALGGVTPIDRCCALIDQTPLHEEVDANFNEADERIRIQHYPTDLAIGRLSARLTAHQPQRRSSVKGGSNRRAQRADP
jgi:transposase InsO family protein